MPNRSQATVRPLRIAPRRILLAVVFAGLATMVPGADQQPLRVVVELGDGGAKTGRLHRIDADGVHLVEEGMDAPTTVPGARVRSVRRQDPAAEAAGGLVVTLVDGSTIRAEAFTWSGEGSAVLSRLDGRIELPIGRIRSVARLPPAGGEPKWLASIPEAAEGDLVVVGTDEAYEFVECGIDAVHADTVAVLLDGEKIAVKRAKVIGLHWLRNDGGMPGSRGPVAVSVTGGELGATAAAWTPEALVLDGSIRLPADALIALDYASARITKLASLKAETTDVEPWFGGLARKEGLASFFAPRAIAAGLPGAAGGPAVPRDAAGLVMRPRTAVVWRLPPESRRFRAVVTAAAGPQAAEPTIVAVAIDDREVFRRQIGGVSAADGDAGAAAGAGMPIEVDLGDARRLKILVDFGPGGGIGGAVIFTHALIER